MGPVESVVTVLLTVKLFPMRKTPTADGTKIAPLKVVVPVPAS